jgi:hypothetical protein
VRLLVFAIVFVLVLGWFSSIAKARLLRLAPASRVETEADWFNLFPPTERKSLERLKEAARKFLDVQDRWGMSGLHLAVSSQWLEGVNALTAAGADRELRYHRTGETALHTAVSNKDERIVLALLRAGANPDAANYWGNTPRKLASSAGLEALFATLPPGPSALPEPRIQNAEQLSYHHADFVIPERAERESLNVGQAVDVHVYGPQKSDVKVRIRQVERDDGGVRYTAVLEPPDQESNFRPGTSDITFGPEHVATIYLKKPAPAQPVGAA